MSKMLYNIAMHRSRGYFEKQYGQDFWRNFKAGSDARLAGILPNVPDIGESVFAFNYLFAPYYIAWYKTLLELGNAPQEADKNLWVMNERMKKMWQQMADWYAKGYFYPETFSKYEYENWVTDGKVNDVVGMSARSACVSVPYPGP